jgi:hypothetical protein
VRALLVRYTKDSKIEEKEVMSNSDKIKGITKEEWRQLGYYYEIDKKSKNWIIIGSPFGLNEFSRQLKEYAKNLKNEGIGEHDHWGPYGYLKIMTWSEPDITDDAIQGSLEDLKQLADLIKDKIQDDGIGKKVNIKSEYAGNADFGIEFQVMPYGFDPASADKSE